MSSGDPAIVEAPILGGRVILVATSASDMSGDSSPWTALTTWPSFPPLVHQLLAAAVAPRDHHRNLQVGQTIEFAGDKWGREPFLQMIHGQRSRRVPIRLDGPQSRWTFSATQTSGFYRAQYGPDGDPARLFAVNLDTRESDVRRVDPRQLPSHLQLRAPAPRRPGHRRRGPPRVARLPSAPGRGDGPVADRDVSGVVYRQSTSMNPPGGNSQNAWLEWFPPWSGLGATDHLEPALQHSWPWPAWVTLLLLLVAGAWVVTIYLCESGRISPLTRLGLMLLRLAQIGLVTLMMYGFVIRPYRTDRPELVLVLDDSASMSRDDGLRAAAPPLAGARIEAAKPSGGTRRIELAKTVLLRNDARLLRALAQRYRLRIHTISSPAPWQWDNVPQLLRALQGLSAKYPASPLGEHVRGAFRRAQGRRLAAVVAITDGVTTEGSSIEDVAGYAAGKDTPLYLVGLGSANQHEMSS